MALISSLFPVFVVLVDGIDRPSGSMGHSRDFAESVLHIFHCVLVVTGFIPDKVVVIAKYICDVVDFDAWVR